jgi:type II protein arginine methyltransferase
MSDDAGMAKKAAAGFDLMIAAAGDHPHKLAALARLAPTIGRGEDAYPLARRARMLAPDDPEITTLTHDAFAAGVPAWHFRIITDTLRNSMFDRAIRRAVTPGARVLDIGAGTGLLAMMAARAGAGHVYSCEMNPAVADAARDIVAANGLADKVTVIARKSTEIDATADLGGPVDVLVSEILSNDLLSEAVLPVMEDAVRRLLRPGGRMVPAAGAVMVALAELPHPGRERLSDIAGFDLSLFERLAPRPEQIRTGDPELTLRSAPQELFGFDFTTGGPWRAPRRQIACVADGGRINGVIQWMRIQLDEATDYEVRPGMTPNSSWAMLFYPFARAITPAAGTPIIVNGVRDDQGVRLWVNEL